MTETAARTWTIHDAEGTILGTFTGAEADLALNLPAGKLATEGKGAASTHYVAGGQIRAKPERPGPHHRWDPGTQSWVWDAAARGAALTGLRRERARRLAACDWTQMADAPLSAESRAAWAVYRQALRDITTTADPEDPDWPSQPTV